MNSTPVLDKIRCYHEFCCYPAIGNFQQVQGYDGVTRTWGQCAFHLKDKS